MNTAIVIDIDSEREEGCRVVIQEVNRTKNDQLIPTEDLDQVDMMGVLCEGVCTLIHTANEVGLKKDYESIKDCINHIESGFVDASYFTKVEKTCDRVLIEPLNAKIEITKIKDNFYCEISNIKLAKLEEFTLSHNFYNQSLEIATLTAMTYIYSAYTEYSLSKI